jgi:hypothetical protein
MEAETLVNRLRSLADNEDLSMNFGAATFPEHALTFDDLLKRAEENLLQGADSPVRVQSHKEVGVG